VELVEKAMEEYAATHRTLEIDPQYIGVLVGARGSNLQRLRQQYFTSITVEDDGVGFDVRELSKENSVGIRNIRFRLRHLVNGTLDITSKIGTGTTVTITIPRKEAEACASFM